MIDDVGRCDDGFIVGMVGRERLKPFGMMNLFLMTFFLCCLLDSRPLRNKRGPTAFHLVEKVLLDECGDSFTAYHFLMEGARPCK